VRGALWNRWVRRSKSILISQKKQEVASGYIQRLGSQIEIQVSGEWVAKQAVMAFDNPGR